MFAYSSAILDVSSESKQKPLVTRSQLTYKCAASSPRGATVNTITMIVCYTRAPTATPVWTASTEPAACLMSPVSCLCQRRRSPRGAPDPAPFFHCQPPPSCQFLCCRTLSQQVGQAFFYLIYSCALLM